MNFTGVLASQVHLVWDQVAPLIQKCADRAREYTPEDIAKRLVEHTAQLWVAMDGDRVVMACVTEIAKQECNILICAGSKRQDWLGFLVYIKVWARDQGCAKMTLVGRKGWLRVLRDWKLTAVEMECAL